MLLGAEAEIAAFRAAADPNECLSLLESNDNPMVLFFACSVVEDAVRTKWSSLGADDRAHVRSFVLGFLLARHTEIPGYVLTKACKICVYAARHDWPHDDPDFLQQALTATRDPSKCEAGLCLLLLAAEEFVAERADAPLPSGRAQQLRDALAANLSEAVATILEVLQGCRDGRYGESGTRNDDIASQALAVLTQLLGWAPLSDHLSPELLETLFALARQRGARIAPPGEVGEPDDESSSSAAVSTLLEIARKRCVPSGYATFIQDVASNGLDVLAGLTADGTDLTDLPGRYLSSFTEFISSFLRANLSRLEETGEFPVGDMMAMLYRFTMAQPDAGGLVACLDFWEFLVDRVLSDAASGKVEGGEYAAGFCELADQLLALAQVGKRAALLETLSDQPTDETDTFGNGADESITEDIDELGSASEHEVALSSALMPTSELETFVHRVISVVNKIAQIPQAVGHVFGAAGSALSDATAALMAEDGDAATASLAARDAATLVGVLAAALRRVLASSAADVDTLSATVANVTALANFTVDSQLHMRGHEFVQCEMRSLIALSSVGGCGEQLCDGGVPTVEMIDGVASTALRALDATISPPPERILFASINVLSTLASSSAMTRTIFLLTPAFQQLQSRFMAIAGSLPERVQAEVLAVVTRTLTLSVASPSLLPREVADAGSSTIEGRPASFEAIVVPCARMVVDAVGDGGVACDGGTLGRVRRGCALVAAVCRAVRNSERSVKAGVHDTLAPVLPACLPLVSTFLAPVSAPPRRLRRDVAPPPPRPPAMSPRAVNAANAVLSLMQTMFDALRVQIGRDSMFELLSGVVEVVSTAVTAHGLLAPGDASQAAGAGAAGGGGNACQAAGLALIVRFLRLLRAIVDEPTRKLEALLPGILAVCHDLSRVVEEDAASSQTLLPAYYVLLRQILLSNWTFFLRRPAGGHLMTAPEFLSDDRAASFFAMLEAFGTALSKVDTLSPAVLRLLLSSLMRLHETHGLFRLQHLAESLLPAFVSTLFHLLLSQSHNYAAEEILEVLHALASSDAHTFCGPGLEAFLGSVDWLDPDTVRGLLGRVAPPDDQYSFDVWARELVSDVRCAASA